MIWKMTKFPEIPNFKQNNVYNDQPNFDKPILGRFLVEQSWSASIQFSPELLKN